MSEDHKRSEGHTRNAILESYTEVVAYRLDLAGQDPTGAPIIATSLWAASCSIFLRLLGNGMQGSMPDFLLNALQSVRDALACQPAKTTDRG